MQLIPLLILFLITSTKTTSTPVTLTLHKLPFPSQPHQHSNPFHHLATLSYSSSNRAATLKSPHKPHSRNKLFPHSYGGYSFSLPIGTPPQLQQLLLDTGSHITWLPCTSSYTCRSCTTTSPIVPFIPRTSSTSRLVGCRNPKCLWIHSPDLLTQCSSCNATINDNCPKVCPPYALIYGSGSTSGLLLIDTLWFPNRTVENFVLGCSVYSDRQPSGGLAGFGRGDPSMPSQLKLLRFSYCLISRAYDDMNNESGSLVLDPEKEDSSNGVFFTPFVKNPIANNDDASLFSVYYYIALRKITVGGAKVKFPSSLLVPDVSGNGGVIIDSGTTFTYMVSEIFQPIAAAIVAGVSGRYNRSSSVEAKTGLQPCFTLPPVAKEVEFPQLVFHFKGGAKMRLPLQNYFVFAGTETKVVCLAVVSDDGGAPIGGGGPAMILGSFQQQNYYMVYDLRRNRLGFRPQTCLNP